MLLVGGVADTNGSNKADNDVGSDNGVLELLGDLGVVLGRLLGDGLALLSELLGKLVLLSENLLLDLSELLLDLLGLLLNLLLLSGSEDGALLLLLGLGGCLVSGVGVALVLVNSAGLVVHSKIGTKPLDLSVTSAFAADHKTASLDYTGSFTPRGDNKQGSMTAPNGHSTDAQWRSSDTARYLRFVLTTLLWCVGDKSEVIIYWQQLTTPAEPNLDWPLPIAKPKECVGCNKRRG